jgi:hypothetical protein
VKHEALAIFALQRIDDLLVTRRAQGRYDQRLGLSTREQRGPVRAREHAVANRNRAH